MAIDLKQFDLVRRNAAAHLLSKRNPRGWWTGCLSSSALSTATAITALELADPRKHEREISCGIQWLIAHQNEDGGWGDTVKSFSNISTTVLCWAALGGSAAARQPLSRCETWLENHCGAMSVDALVEAIVKRYGKDRTFSVPILTMGALKGKIPWDRVMRLPFELAALPQGLFRFVNMQVVSYALPALIAIGQVAAAKRQAGLFGGGWLRGLFKQKTLRVLERIQPGSGGFLEATPLTSFVVMSLAGMGLADHPVARRGVEFLARSMRTDGSWAIDTNLATWVTTLSVNALASGSRLNEYLDERDRSGIRDWLLGQQYRVKHPYTGAAPGGWAWTDLPGGVPDADDTAGALLALWHLQGAGAAARQPLNEEVKRAVRLGMNWLLKLQNGNGGMPTFCRGWGRLPFDQSCPDITAHAMRAWEAWWKELSEWDRHWFDDCLPAAGAYISEQQSADGSWAPLWFGNQQVAGEENRTYGTSRVAMAGQDPAWLMNHQNDDGGWGAGEGSPSTIEETALAVEAVAEFVSREMKTRSAGPPLKALERGVGWLIENTKGGTEFSPSPIGFYFAKLWYYEELYPVIFTVAALERAARVLK